MTRLTPSCHPQAQQQLRSCVCLVLLADSSSPVQSTLPAAYRDTFDHTTLMPDTSCNVPTAFACPSPSSAVSLANPLLPAETGAATDDVKQDRHLVSSTWGNFQRHVHAYVAAHLEPLKKLAEADKCSWPAVALLPCFAGAEFKQASAEAHGLSLELGQAMTSCKL